MPETRLEQVPESKLENEGPSFQSPEIISAMVETPATKPGGPRTKSTLNLHNIFSEKGGEVKQAKENGTKYKKRKLLDSEVKEAWKSYAELRKMQVAEHSLLQREYHLEENVIKLQLTNPVEETLLASIKTDLITYLKERLQCEISLEGVLQKTESKKMIYTNREKFDHLAEKHPALRELKERLGLDTDY